VEIFICAAATKIFIVIEFLLQTAIKFFFLKLNYSVALRA